MIGRSPRSLVDAHGGGGGGGGAHGDGAGGGEDIDMKEECGMW
jgi:hypothetical protein